jgi:hypothetical protein
MTFRLLKIFTPLTLRFQDFQRRLLALNLFAKLDLIQLIKAEPPPDDCSFMQVDLWCA